jgi:hypothetical protein
MQLSQDVVKWSVEPRSGQFMQTISLRTTDQYICQDCPMATHDLVDTLMSAGDNSSSEYNNSLGASVTDANLKLDAIKILP